MKILYCPSRATHGRDANGTLYLTDYALNYYLCKDSPSGGSAPVAVSGIASPTELIQVADSDIEWFSTVDSNSIAGRNGFRHNGFANLLWCDGSVSSKRRHQVDIEQNDPKGGSNVYYKH